jgi:2-amino-4-hydroxy-6-hydroxymethyldihydropteridine diphosphokinase
LPERAFISLGSNIEPERYLPLAVNRLKALGNVVAVSRVYQNPAVGDSPQPDFLNAAVLLETDLSLVDLRRCLRVIEDSLGRVRTEDKYAPRTIDLDLCLYGNTFSETREQTLPDPDILTRAHLAVPLAELAPDLHHPLIGDPLRDIAERLRPQSRLVPRADVLLPGTAEENH